MQRDTSSLLTSILDPLIEQFSIILNSPVQSQNPDDWSMQMEVYTPYRQYGGWMCASLVFSGDSYSCLILRCWNVYFSLFRTFLDCLKLKFLASIHTFIFCIALIVNLCFPDRMENLYSHSSIFVADICFVVQDLSSVIHSRLRGFRFCWLWFWW